MKTSLILALTLGGMAAGHAGLSPEYVEEVLSTSPRIDAPTRGVNGPINAHEVILYTPPKHGLAPIPERATPDGFPTLLRKQMGVYFLELPAEKPGSTIKLDLGSPSLQSPAARDLSFDRLDLKPSP